MSAQDYVRAIRESGLSIYDPIEIGSPLYIPSTELEYLLNAGLKEFSTQGLPIRTRSKSVKSRICEILGYPIPASFKRVRPRFSGQNFDVYVQKSDNLQVWNEELSAIRRYVLVREIRGTLTAVRVVTGETLAKLDTTGTLTQKYQARFGAAVDGSELISPSDTGIISPLLCGQRGRKYVHGSAEIPGGFSPVDYPSHGNLLPIAELFNRLSSLVGAKFPDAGRDQERNRGAALHRLVCAKLGYRSYADDGRFPDVKHQLLEIKLQTASTIDLGLVTPASGEPLDIPKIGNAQIKHSDVRYALFSARTSGLEVTICGLYLCTGADFFSRFPRFGGRVLNKKLQIPLPADLFDTENLRDVVL